MQAFIETFLFKVNIVLSHLALGFYHNTDFITTGWREREAKIYFEGRWCLLNLSEWMIQLSERRKWKAGNFETNMKSFSWLCWVDERIFRLYRCKLSQFTFTDLNSNTCFIRSCATEKVSFWWKIIFSLFSLTASMRNCLFPSSLNSTDIEKCPWCAWEMHEKV